MKVVLVDRVEKLYDALLVGLVDAEGPRTIEAEEEVGDGGARRPKPADRGPIVVCLDVSGSMTGWPGTTAHAIVLHVALTAYAEGRPCHVLSFSGPGDVIEHPLSFDANALEHVIAFLHLRFEGGTDVSEPIRRAIEMHAEAKWQNADILLVSDGAFEVPKDIVAKVTRARATSGLRIHGLVVGAGGSAATEGLCTEVHRLNDWLRADAKR